MGCHDLLCFKLLLQRFLAEPSFFLGALGLRASYWLSGLRLNGGINNLIERCDFISIVFVLIVACELARLFDRHLSLLPLISLHYFQLGFQVELPHQVGYLAASIVVEHRDVHQSILFYLVQLKSSTLFASQNGLECLTDLGLGPDRQVLVEKVVMCHNVVDALVQFHILLDVLDV